MQSNTPAQHFGKRAHLYSEHAETQIKAAHTLVQLLIDKCKNWDGLWVDLGSGPGVITDIIDKTELSFSLLSLDLSEYSLLQCSSSLKLCADMDNLPLLPNTLSGIISSSAIQWSNNYPQLLQNCHDLLQGNGVLAISVFTDETLLELRNSQEKFNITSAVTFPNHQKLREDIQKSGFTLIDENRILYEEEFEDGFEAIRAISSIGASFTHSKPQSPSRLRHFVNHFTSQFETSTCCNRYVVSQFIAKRNK